MFVPFDKLYDFLDQYTDYDTLIYRFHPDGSKKYSDICALRAYDNLKSWKGHLISIPMLMHDQEPLNFDLYRDIDKNEVLKFLHLNEPGLLNACKTSNIQDHIVKIYQNNNLNLFAGSFLTDGWLLCHSEKNSVELTKYKSLGAIDVYWWSHAMIARDWYRYAQIDQRLTYDTASFSKDFNLYNRAWGGTREYRLKFAEMIIKNDLIQSTSTSISEFDNKCHYRDHIFKNKMFLVDTDLSILNENQSCSNASAEYCPADYLRSAIDVVLETLFDDSRIHLTEKVLRPIACGKPFILASTPGSLQYLRDYGFETFGVCINENYDTITDPLERLEHIINVMKDISNLSKVGKYNLYHELHLISARNKKKFWSNNFAQKIIDEFTTNFRQANQICKDLQNGNQWIDQRKRLSSASDKFRQWLCSDTPSRSRQDIAKLLLEIKKTST